MLLAATTAVPGPDYARLALRLLLDVAALWVAIYLLYFRRHGRRDVLMAYACFNLGLFAVLSVTTVKHFSAAFGFGLFAILSIIRLRSEPFTNQEVAYFFVALVLGLVNGIETGHVLYSVALDGLVLVGVYFADHPDLLVSVGRRRVVLDEVLTDEAELRRVLEERLDVEIRDLEILDIDYVRDTTRVDVRFAPRAPRRDAGDVAATGELAR